MATRDEEIRRSVKDALRRDPDLDPTDVTVTVTDSVVVLAGFVGSLPEQERAERDALQVDGVAAVADEIEIRVPAADVKPDPVLARQAVESLRFELPEVWDRIIVSVRAAWADLEGQVDDSRQRERAEAAMRRVRGLRGFTNLIRVRASVPVARSPAANR